MPRRGASYYWLRLAPPLAYSAFVRLLGQAALVITDSGGIEEEAPSLGVPVLVTRNTTERTEALDMGLAHLVGTDRPRIVKEAGRLLAQPDTAWPRSSPYGDGRAAHRIAGACAALLSRGSRPCDWNGAGG
ncbi:UDP-N-acetylglucosamine 2-epimerase [Streptomyces flaveolus]|uniref:UDP-N-acetylglucosamine 2-epimerase n=1 Tax=Streptomyces flaveolus TaxID=67297 RepID=UPI0033339E85